MWAWGLFYHNMIFHEITYITYTMSHYIVILYYIGTYRNNIIIMVYHRRCRIKMDDGLYQSRI